MKYAFIQDHREQFRVKRLCEVLEVSRSGYYEWCGRPESPRSCEDRRLGEQIKATHEKSRQTYGTRRIQRDLTEEGEQVSRARIGRLMRRQGLEAKARRRFKATTDSRHTLPVADNHLNRNFEVKEPDRVYVGDITYIPTAEGWLYLAVLIDLYSRMVVGWAMSARMTADLVGDALKMAIGKRRPPKELMVHHDRGSQYASHRYRQTLDEHQYVLSMSRKGNCWDNAPAESFFKTLKTELVHGAQFQSRDQAKQEIFEYIEVFYNRRRRHSSIEYQAPANYDAQHSKPA